jgi:hypothetical protein
VIVFFKPTCETLAMPITATCTNAACAKTLQVKDELAGKNVQCPACGTVMPIPGLDHPAVVELPRADGAVPPPLPALDQALAIPLYIGLGGLGLLFLSCVLPWITVPFFGSVLGVHYGSGIVLMLLALAAGGGLGFGAFGKREFLPLTLLGGAGTGTFGFITFFWFLIRVGSLAGFGIYIGLLASLAAAGALSFASVKAPYRVPFLQKEGTAPFLRDFGGLIGAHAAGFVLGLFIALLSTNVSSGRM